MSNTEATSQIWLLGTWNMASSDWDVLSVQNTHCISKTESEEQMQNLIIIASTYSMLQSQYYGHTVLNKIYC